ncbi:hypothetical protein PL81_12020 [Streptomyces sp. RSD-27]|nr:hypothetical protein PL81_12020 [Streptomyces sp. RSD-27]
MHLLADDVHNCVGGSVREGGFPCGGTGFQISARRAGANRVPAASRTLSTGCLRQAAEMISISYPRADR